MKKETPVRNAFILCAITLTAGLLLSFVNELTLEPIAEVEQKAKAEAYISVYRDAASFEDVEDLQLLIDSSEEIIEKAGYSGGYITDAMKAADDSGQTIGFVVSAGSKNGYGGDITIALGIDLTGTITGFKPLSHSETPGFGAKCEDPGYIETFSGIKEAGEVDAISGATYTTNALREAVGAGLAFVKTALLENG